MASKKHSNIRLFGLKFDVLQEEQDHEQNFMSCDKFCCMTNLDFYILLARSTLVKCPLFAGLPSDAVIWKSPSPGFLWSGGFLLVRFFCFCFSDWFKMSSISEQRTARLRRRIIFNCLKCDNFFLYLFFSVQAGAWIIPYFCDWVLRVMPFSHSYTVSRVYKVI